MVREQHWYVATVDSLTVKTWGVGRDSGGGQGGLETFMSSS